MQSESELKPVEVFAGSPIQAGFIKSVLEDNGIQVFLYNELMGSIAPWRVEAGGIDPVKVIVSSEDRQISLQLIEEFNSSGSAEQD